MLELTDQMERVAGKEKAFVYFTASWCQPCKMIKPHFIKVANNDPNNEYFIIDVDTIDTAWLQTYNIQSVPKIYMLKNGDVVHEIRGRTHMDMQKEIESL